MSNSRKLTIVFIVDDDAESHLEKMMENSPVDVLSYLTEELTPHDIALAHALGIKVEVNNE